MGFTVDELIAGAKVRAFYPATGGALTDAEIVRLANGELVNTVFPAVLEAKGNWNVYTKTHAIVSGTARYRVPKAAYAGRLKELRYVDASGNVRDVSIIDVSQTPLIAREYSRETFCAYMQRGDLVLAQTPNESVGSLLMDYYRRPGQLALVADCGTITSVASAGGGNVRLSCSGGVPSTFGDDTLVDVIQGGGTFDTIAADVDPEDVDLTSDFVDVSEDDVSLTSAEAGDYIALAGYSPIPQVPDIAHPWLEQLVAVKLLESERDLQAMALAQGKADIMRVQMIEQLTPRVENEPPIVVPIHSPYRCG